MQRRRSPEDPCGSYKNGIAGSAQFPGQGGAFGLSCLIAATGAVAHSRAEGIVEQRMGFMGAMGKAMRTVGLQADESPDMFAQGSLSGPGKAREQIWANRDRFATMAKEFSNAATRLPESAAHGDRRAVAGTFNETGKSRGGCHEAFRLKKQTKSRDTR